MRSRTNETRNRNKKIKYSKLMIFGMTDNNPKVIKEIFKELFAVTSFFNICNKGQLLKFILLCYVMLFITVMGSVVGLRGPRYVGMS